MRYLMAGWSSAHWLTGHDPEKSDRAAARLPQSHSLKCARRLHYKTTDFSNRRVTAVLANQLLLLLYINVICYALSIHAGESVQLFYKYNLDVTYCCSGAIVAAVCDDFRSDVFSR